MTSVNRKFQKNIFQVWIQGCDKIVKKEFNENRRNWMTLNPDWNYYCVSEIELRKVCYAYNELCGNIYDSLKIMHLKIDLGRYVYLYLYGGMYADMDAYVLRSLGHSNEIKDLINSYEIENKHILGLSTIHVNTLESLVVSGGTKVLNNAVMFSSKENPLLKQFIDLVLENIKNMGSGTGSTFFDVSTLTGPMAVNRFFQKYTNANLPGYAIHIFPSTIFEPCAYTQPCDITDNTLSIHKMELSWVPKGINKMMSLYYIVKNNIPWILFASFLYYTNFKDRKKR